jgi:iron-sulfur cluster assembly protein
MLTLTIDAAEAVRSALAAAPDLPDDAGLRILPSESGEETGLGLALAAAPEEDDEVIDEEGARVFVAPEVASYLEDKVLDAEQIENRIQFSVAEQAE